jgi:hypothetical protein
LIHSEPPHFVPRCARARRRSGEAVISPLLVAQVFE